MELSVIRPVAGVTGEAQTSYVPNKEKLPLDLSCSVVSCKFILQHTAQRIA